jgi:hypothetical protein
LVDPKVYMISLKSLVISYTTMTIMLISLTQ